MLSLRLVYSSLYSYGQLLCIVMIKFFCIVIAMNLFNTVCSYYIKNVTKRFIFYIDKNKIDKNKVCYKVKIHRVRYGF